MRNRKAALFLSFICPGLGQIYRREILKGISFIAICVLLILSLFFRLSPPPLLYYSGLSILLLMWLVCMLDAYVDDELLMGSQRWLTWQKLLSILPVAVIFIAVIALMVFWMQDFSETNRRMVARASAKMAQNTRIPEDELDHTGGRPDHTRTSTGIGAEVSSLEFFSIQVASFRDLERAKEVYQDLLSKGYTVKIEQAVSANEVWHRVLVGKFSSEQDAISFTERLREREQFSHTVVRRRSSE